MNSHKKIIVGMSGGVDSSVCAILLKEQGYDVSGLFMKNWEEDDDENNCNSQKDYNDALRISKKLGIKLSTVNFSDKYWDLVFKRFIDELHKGLTPNPDIYCNKEIKFNYFLKYALSQSCDKLATGHYAKIEQQNNLYSLKIPKDKVKDQTYFLYMLNQEILKNLLFPLEDIEKDDVKRIVKGFDISVYEKKESMGICFIGKKNFSNFIKKYINSKPGDIYDENGIVLGQHTGIFNYTLGQRKGIKIGGLKGYNEKPWYVIKKDNINNSLIVSQDADKLLSPRSINLNDTTWINQSPSETLEYMVRFRHGGKLLPAKVVIKNNKYILNMIELERAVTPGQSAVIYYNNECIGGGIVS